MANTLLSAGANDMALKQAVNNLNLNLEASFLDKLRTTSLFYDYSAVPKGGIGLTPFIMQYKLFSE